MIQILILLFWMITPLRLVAKLKPFIVRTDVEAQTPILWPPDAKSWLIWKDPDAGKDWRQEEKETTENEMVGWHHRLNGHGFGWISGSWWFTGRPGVLRFMGLQRVGHVWEIEMNSTELLFNHFVLQNHYQDSQI